jgi:exosortase
MNSSSSSVSTAPQPVTSAWPVNGWMFGAVLLLIWGSAFRQWSYDWSTNPQYFYGWAVPFLAGYLLYERWLEKPSPAPPERFGFVAMLALAAAVAQIPLRWFGEANSDWWPVWWGYGLVCLVATFGLIFLVGGWPWLRVMVFPFLFILTAIPWPTYLEIDIVQGLMSVNAAISAELVSAMGYYAMAIGNVIEVEGGVLGVNEACSGIRSLQSTLMASIFLIGLYRLRVPGGLLLVAAGAGIAFLCNVVRTTFLTYQGAAHGIKATEEYHDSAGFAVLGVVLVCLFVISQFLDKQSRKSRP